MQNLILLTGPPLEQDGFWYDGYWACRTATSSNGIPRSRPSTEDLPPLAIRIIQSILNRSSKETGFKSQYVNPDTVGSYPHNADIVGVSVVDPFGLAPIPRTQRLLFGGDNWTSLEFNRLMRSVHTRFERAVIIVGGAGAWQIDESDMKRMNIDHVFRGEAEYVLPEFLKQFSKRDPPQQSIVDGHPCLSKDIPAILDPAAFGLVEVTRGCGRKCSFCRNAPLGPVRSVPPQTILDSIRNTIRNGQASTITLQTDDLMLYGAHDNQTETGKPLLTLLESIAGQNACLERIVPLHFAPSSLVSNKDITIRVLQKLSISGEGISVVQIGLETASPRLIRKYMDGKTAPFEPEEWTSVCGQAIELLSGSDIVPVGTIIIGFPDECEDDINETSRLVEKLSEYRTVIVPILFSPPVKRRHAEEENLIASQRELLGQPYYARLFELVKENNSRWLPVASESPPCMADHSPRSLTELALIWNALLEHS